MTTSQRALVSALAVGGWLGNGYGQPMISRPAPDVLLSTQFRTPLSYQAALARLDEYYDEQIGRKRAVAFPEIAPDLHYDVWHDMWVNFDPAEGGTMVTVKRPSNGSAGRPPCALIARSPWHARWDLAKGSLSSTSNRSTILTCTSCVARCLRSLGATPTPFRRSNMRSTAQCVSTSRWSFQ